MGSRAWHCLGSPHGTFAAATGGVKMLQSATTSSCLLLLPLLPFSSSLPLLLSDMLPSQPIEILDESIVGSSTSSISPSESSKISSSANSIGDTANAMGDLLSNKADFLGDQASLLGNQMEEKLKGLEEQLEGKEKEEEVLRERLEHLKSD